MSDAISLAAVVLSMFACVSDSTTEGQDVVVLVVVVVLAREVSLAIWRDTATSAKK